MTGPKVQFHDLDDIKCDSCGDTRFQSIVVIKKIPAIISDSGKEQAYPFPTFACLACGHVNALFLPKRIVSPDEVGVANGDTEPVTKPTIQIVR